MSTSALLAAARGGKLDQVQRALQEGAIVSHTDKDGWTALHYAASQGHEPVVRALLEAGSNPNVHSNALDTPLHLAAEYGYEGVVMTLLQFKANPKATDDNGETPLDVAKENDHHKVADMLDPNRVAKVTSSLDSGGLSSLLLSAGASSSPKARSVPAPGRVLSADSSDSSDDDQDPRPKPVSATPQPPSEHTARTSPKALGGGGPVVVQLKQEVAELRKQLSDSEKRCRAHAHKAASSTELEAEVAELKQELKQLEREKKQQRQTDHLERNRLENEAKSLKQQLQKAQTEVTQMKAEMEEEQRKSASANAVLDPKTQLRQKVMEKELEQLKRDRQRKEQLEKENADLVKQLKALQMSAKDNSTSNPRATASSSQRAAPIQSFGLQELSDATERFSKKNRLGAGSFGAVFRGTLHGMPVAIKRIDDKSMQGLEDLHLEVDVLGSFGHKHIVQLYGWSPEGRCLVTELCERGSLEDNLPSLTWHERIRVMVEVARGLLFLHLRKPDAVVHRDLKPANVLVDRYGVAKLGDVGLAKMMPNPGMSHNATHASTQMLAGTYAYMDPEYIQRGEVAPGSDVYSFGMMMLEMLTGLSPTKSRLQDVVEDSLEGSSPAKMIDPASGVWPEASAVDFARLALKCIQPRRRRRPHLETEVLPELERLRTDAITGGAAADTALQLDIERIKDDEQRRCVMCKNAAPTHAFLPCMHRCVCEKDGALVLQQGKRCPVCLERAEDCRQVHD